ncbi:MAG: hypothetical protein GWP19_03905 [Planctomycetia bacterium]|nr:hypothetical protein [Planctomycetia bacterium]
MTCLRESESENVKLKKELKCYSEQTLRLIYRDKDFNKKTVGGTSYELEREIDKLITGEYR